MNNATVLAPVLAQTEDEPMEASQFGIRVSLVLC